MNDLPKVIRVQIRRVIDKMLIACLGCMVMNNPESEIKHKLVIKVRKSEDLFFYTKAHIAWKVALWMTLAHVSPVFKKNRSHDTFKVSK